MNKLLILDSRLANLPAFIYGFFGLLIDLEYSKLFDCNSMRLPKSLLNVFSGRFSGLHCPSLFGFT